VLGAAALIASSCGSSSGHQSAATTTPPASTKTTGVATKSPIVLGYIGDLTGLASSTFADGAAGAQARIDLQNAEGGVDGHPLEMVTADTESSPEAAATAAEELVQSKHVFAVMENSALFFGAAPYLAKVDVPVTGTGIDGPEWATDPNLFDSIGPPVDGPIAGHIWTTTGAATFFKSLGATKVAGDAAATPSSTQALEAVFDTFPKSGLSTCYLNTSQPLGGIDVTSVVLAIKNAGCNGLYVSNVDSTDIAFGQGLKNAGLKLNATFLAEGYDNSVLDSAAARASVQGDYFDGEINFTTPNAPTSAMLAALRKYDPAFTGGIPDLGLYGGWSAADLMILGLKDAGATPTHASFINNLHQVSNYDIGGLAPSSWGFTNFGTAKMLPKTACGWFFQLKGDTFVSANNGKPYCGTYIETPVK
jgi:branched-chain amino acid transport system substrate-binding protein